VLRLGLRNLGNLGNDDLFFVFVYVGFSLKVYFVALFQVQYWCVKDY
jgi:hypothetical protein